MNRRSVFAPAGMSAVAAAAGGSDAASVRDKPIVRVSFGWYPPEKEAAVAAILDYAGKPLGEAIKKLPGLIAYYSGIDRERHAMVNVSLWIDLPSAEQMGKLQAMLDQGAELGKLGVTFVRPIPNCTTSWSELPAG